MVNKIGCSVFFTITYHGWMQRSEKRCIQNIHQKRKTRHNAGSSFFWWDGIGEEQSSFLKHAQKLIIIVDQEGIEPSSKQGNNKLSTCLSLLWGFRVATRPKPPALQPYLLSVSPRLRSQDVTIPDIIAPLNQDASEKELLSDVSFQQSLVGIKLMYYTSIKQRERSYFRQLNFWKPRL